MNWQFNVYSVPILLVCGLLTNYLVIGWRWRHQASTRWYIRFTWCALVFSLMYVAELSTSNVATMYLLDIAALFPGILATTFLLMFALSYSGYEHLLTPRVQFALLVVPILHTMFIWTDSLHHQYLVSLTRLEVNGLYFLRADVYFSPLLLLFFFYFLVLQLSTFVVLFHTMAKSAPHVRKQYIFMIIALLPTLIATFVDATGTNPFPYLNIHRFALCISIVPLGWALVRLRLLDIMPIAYDVIIMSMQDAVIILDPHQRIIEVNAVATALVGKTPDQLLGLPLEEGFAALPEMVAAWQQSNSTQKTVALAIHIQENTRFFDTRISPVYYRNGWLGGSIGVLRDITDSRRAEAQAEQIRLQQLEVELLRSFIRDASHDLKTPITVIRSSVYLQQKYLERLTQQLESMEKELGLVASVPVAGHSLTSTVEALRDKCNNIEGNAGRLQMMIDSMLELAQLDQENAIQLVLSDMNELIEITLQPFRDQAQQKAVSLIYESAPSPVQTLLDPVHFPVVIAHLILNAVTYTPNGGTIHISVHGDEKCVTIEVRDSGVGISADDLPHIFERFYRADKARSMEDGGMGLGLAISKKIVEAHSGSLQVESVIGSGSTFRVFLPLPLSIGPRAHGT